MQNFFQNSTDKGFEITLTKSTIGEQDKKRIYYMEPHQDTFIMHDVSADRLERTEILSQLQTQAFLMAIQSGLVEGEKVIIKDEGKNNAL